MVKNTRRQSSSPSSNGHNPSPAVPPERLDLPSEADQLTECQEMNLITLREVFARRHSLTRKEARGASMVFRGVAVQLRAIECGQRE